MINDDLICLEKMDNVFEKMKDNYNPFCPFCGAI